MKFDYGISCDLIMSLWKSPKCTLCSNVVGPASSIFAVSFSEMVKDLDSAGADRSASAAWPMNVAMVTGTPSQILTQVDGQGTEVSLGSSLMPVILNGNGSTAMQ